MNLKELIKEGIDTLSHLYPEREAREMVYACLEKFIGTTRHTHILEPYYKVEEEDLIVIRGAFTRMASGEPLQYTLNQAWFYGRRFNVTPDVLIPRPETEILCRSVLDNIAGADNKGLRILDLCTGSGCIAWTLAIESPGVETVAVDISEGALGVARNQDFADEMSAADVLGPEFIKADVLGMPLTELGCFDVIVSNPPYVMESEKALMRSNVLDHEPHLALFVPDDDPLVFYRAVARWSLQLLRSGGYGIVEINEALAFDTEEIFRDMKFTEVRTIRDLNDKDRFVEFRKK